MNGSTPKRPKLSTDQTPERAGITHYYRKTDPPQSLLPFLQEELRNHENHDIEFSSVQTESCFNIHTTRDLTAEETTNLEWLLKETFDPNSLQLEQTFFTNNTTTILEFGPRMTFTSAFSSNATSICQACHLPVDRLEVSFRYQFTTNVPFPDTLLTKIKGLLHDKMTQLEYVEPLTTFTSGATAKPVRVIPILEQGRSALEAINNEMGLGFDDFDLDYYTELFQVCNSLGVCLSNVVLCNLF
jgi:phosphoribosylformylglycinamidine synthase